MISVIIPMYNVERFLDNSLNSVLNNTFQDFELLLIDDGSEDNTLEIAKKYALKDRRVRVIEKAHTGVSNTRNIGLDQAKGEYIAFIDADDFVTSNYLERLYQFATENDLDWAVCDSFVNRFKRGKEAEGIKKDLEVADLIYQKSPKTTEEIEKNNIDFRYPSFPIETIITKENLKTVLQTIFYNGKRKNMPNNVMCLYKKAVIDQNSLRINEEIIYGEDLLFNYVYAHHIYRFGYIPEKLYIINSREDSSSGNYLSMGDSKELKQLFDALGKIRHEYGEVMTYPEMVYIRYQMDFYMNRICSEKSYKKAKLVLDEFTENMKNCEEAQILRKQKDVYQCGSISFRIKTFFLTRNHYHATFMIMKAHELFDKIIKKKK